MPRSIRCPDAHAMPSKHCCSAAVIVTRAAHAIWLIFQNYTDMQSVNSFWETPPAALGTLAPKQPGTSALGSLAYGLQTVDGGWRTATDCGHAHLSTHLEHKALTMCEQHEARKMGKTFCYNSLTGGPQREKKVGVWNRGLSEIFISPGTSQVTRSGHAIKMELRREEQLRERLHEWWEWHVI